MIFGAKVLKDVATGGGGLGVVGVTPPNEHKRYHSGKFAKCRNRKSGKVGPPEIRYVVTSDK